MNLECSNVVWRSILLVHLLYAYSTQLYLIKWSVVFLLRSPSSANAVLFICFCLFFVFMSTLSFNTPVLQTFSIYIYCYDVWDILTMVLKCYLFIFYLASFCEVMQHFLTQNNQENSNRTENLHNPALELGGIYSCLTVLKYVPFENP